MIRQQTTTRRNLRVLASGLLLALFLGAPALAGEGPLPSCHDAERFADESCRGRKTRPESIEEFLARPSTSEWEAQLELGWGGSDGSTAVADVIADVRIGRTSREHGDIDLPAIRHDWYYELGRTYDLGWRFRRAADQSYRDMCLKRLDGVAGLRGAAARLNVQLRYAAVRMTGFGAWLAHPGPATEARDAAQVAAR